MSAGTRGGGRGGGSGGAALPIILLRDGGLPAAAFDAAQPSQMSALALSSASERRAGTPRRGPPPTHCVCCVLRRRLSPLPTHLPPPTLIKARLLYHEAAGVVGASDADPSASQRRSQLLQEAYTHAAAATALAPGSYSCAALRATLAINLLLEESALLPLGARLVAAGKKGTKAAAVVERKCGDLRERLVGAMEACRASLAHAAPARSEPVILIDTGSHSTSDPCSMVRLHALGGAWTTACSCMQGSTIACMPHTANLSPMQSPQKQHQSQTKLDDWVAEGRWQELLEEKRGVLASMMQVLDSCHALLDATTAARDNNIKLLQHILRCGAGAGVGVGVWLRG